MSDKKFVRCPVCEADLDARGWQGHSRKKTHVAALERMGVKSVEPIPVTDGGETLEEVDLATQYEARILELEQELAAGRTDKESPELTAENVESVIGLKSLEATAEGKLVSMNRQARREDRRPLWDNEGEFADLLAEEVAQLKADLVARQSQFAKSEGSGTRTMKMLRLQSKLKPKGAWMAVGVPVEDQVNNGAAGPGVNIYKMRDKTYLQFKVMTPYRCELDNCWLSARFPQENPKFCTQAHASLIPQALGSNRAVLSQNYTEQLG